MKIPKLPSRTVSILAICGLTVAAFALLMLLPGYRHTQALDKDISELSTRLEQQKVLFPVFQRLIEKAREQVPEGLAPPEKKPLARSEAGKITSTVNQLGRDAGVEVLRAMPDVESLIDSSKQLSVSLTARGDFFRLREFIESLTGLAYYDDMDRLELTAIPGGKELRLQFRVLQE